jgi:hypothetical protein
MNKEEHVPRGKEKQLATIICWICCIATIGFSLSAIATQNNSFWELTIAAIIALFGLEFIISLLVQREQMTRQVLAIRLVTFVGCSFLVIAMRNLIFWVLYTGMILGLHLSVLFLNRRKQRKERGQEQ